MKNLITLFFLVTSNIIIAQNGKIYPKNEVIFGKENTYIYEHSNKTELPECIVANVKFYREIITSKLSKKGNKFEFSVKVPESVYALILTISDCNNNVVDNNDSQGYVVYLKTKTEEEKLQSELFYLNASDISNKELDLHIDMNNVIKRLDEIYGENLRLKEGEMYFESLYLKYQYNRLKTEPEIIKHIDYLRMQDDEKSLIYAMQLNAIIGRLNEREQMQQLIKLRFPKGFTSKNKFIIDFNRSKVKSEKSILESLLEYKMKFNDSTSQLADTFYLELLRLKIKDKDTLTLKNYEDKINVKVYITRIYNQYAWDLSGGDIESAGKDLNYARYLARKTMDITKYAMENPEEHGGHDMQDFYNNYADTYALILYKLKEYNLAFKYQDEVRKQNGLDKGGKERYAAIAEKAKGLKFTKDYLEEQLTAGLDSKIMMNQLEAIYQELNLSDKKFNNLKETSVKLATEKSQKEIIEMYGAIKATDFSLVNLKGKTVKLSDYKGKIVVLDFWATWCGPCRASFPNMQKLVNKYQNDNVEFFFIDAFERGEKEDIKKNVTKLISDDNYTFNVLFDFDNKVAEKFKVKLIPMKVVINKKGKIISVNSSEDNLDALIKGNLN